MNARFVPPMALAGVGNVVLLADDIPAPNQRCDIHGPDGRALWHAVDFADVPRVINMFRLEGNADWLGQVFVTPWESARIENAGEWEPLGAADGLPLELRDGLKPLLRFTGTDLGTGSQTGCISVACGTWSADITIELALLHLDDFTDGSRARLAAVVGYFYGVSLVRGAE
ncbi:hypothetical protein ASF61_16935 [Duganella sp. Leaf126]|uniref:hypothetical protein n=1 Tax=Duganella sp. Leaf126 TaxID=1736266 RepID=UPI0006FFED88|nr:hypothetical protein [Duganella sp. Leaf126]KQQ32019.1 hypothetical protein ASF61_16935 [Duganella sp. Leaf126]